MVLTCGTVASLRAPADSCTHFPSDKAGVAVATATFKAAALDADVVAVVAVAAIRVAVVTKDVVDADTTVGAKVHTTKEPRLLLPRQCGFLQPRRWGLVQQHALPSIGIA